MFNARQVLEQKRTTKHGAASTALCRCPPRRLEQTLPPLCTGSEIAFRAPQQSRTRHMSCAACRRAASSARATDGGRCAPHAPIATGRNRSTGNMDAGRHRCGFARPACTCVVAALFLSQAALRPPRSVRSMAGSVGATIASSRLSTAQLRTGGASSVMLRQRHTCQHFQRDAAAATYMNA